MTLLAFHPLADIFPLIEAADELFARSRRDGWDVWGNEAPAMEPQCPNGHAAATPITDEEAFAKTGTRRKE
jgi:hypothetical protein